MVLAVLRDELVLGSIVSAGADFLTNFALKHFGNDTGISIIRGVSVCALNIVIMHSTGSLAATIPGFAYGIGLQIAGIFKEEFSTDVEGVPQSIEEELPEPPTFSELYARAAAKAKETPLPKYPL